MAEQQQHDVRKMLKFMVPRVGLQADRPGIVGAAQRTSHGKAACTSTLLKRRLLATRLFQRVEYTPGDFRIALRYTARSWSAC